MKSMRRSKKHSRKGSRRRSVGRRTSIRARSSKYLRGGLKGGLKAESPLTGGFVPNFIKNAFTTNSASDGIKKYYRTLNSSKEIKPNLSKELEKLNSNCSKSFEFMQKRHKQELKDLGDQCKNKSLEHQKKDEYLNKLAHKGKCDAPYVGARAFSSKYNNLNFEKDVDCSLLTEDEKIMYNRWIDASNVDDELGKGCNNSKKCPLRPFVQENAFTFEKPVNFKPKYNFVNDRRTILEQANLPAIEREVRAEQRAEVRAEQRAEARAEQAVEQNLGAYRLVPNSSARGLHAVNLNVGGQNIYGTEAESDRQIAENLSRGIVSRDTSRNYGFSGGRKMRR